MKQAEWGGGVCRQAPVLKIANFIATFIFFLSIAKKVVILHRFSRA